VLRRVFGPKRDKVTRSAINYIMRSFIVFIPCQNCSGKPEGKRPLRKTRRSWEDNIKMDLQKVG
jgi:hypothetical protein